MKNKHRIEIERESILIKDGVNQNEMNNYNKEITSVDKIIENNGRLSSWSHTLVNSDSNSATLIAQMPGEGNRLHYHPDWNEWWYILEGKWEWKIEGEKKTIKAGDIVFMKKNRKHQITAKGNKIAIRLAVSREGVEHIYPDDE